MQAPPLPVLSDLTRSVVRGLLLTGFIAVPLASPAQTRPLLEVAAEPLYMNGAKTKANLTIVLSVDAPTVGQAHRGGTDWKKAIYTASTTYTGYFDANWCYNFNPQAEAAGGSYFKEVGPATNRTCAGSGFSGNFMNWATASNIDILRLGLTGGNRHWDKDGETLLQRAWLPNNFYRRGNHFSARFISKADAAGVVDSALFNRIPLDGMWIYNCKNRVYFANAQDNVSFGAGSSTNLDNRNSYGDCDNPFNKPATDNSHPNLLGPTASQTWWEVRVRVCDASTAQNRLMSLDPATKRWTGLCFPYPNGKYKPVGQLQMNADSARIAVFSYLKEDDKRRYGGVLRSPLKYLGPKHYDANFNLINTVNPRREWDPNTGIFVDDPHSNELGDNLKVGGAINYINKYGTLPVPAFNSTYPHPNWGIYKFSDPMAEIYYEALRYLQGKQPTLEAVTGIAGSTSTVQSAKDFFPAYHAWTDPFTGFADSPGTTPSCLRNTLLTVGDNFTWLDRSVPGNTIIPAYSNHYEFTRPVETNPTLDVPFWTSVVGSFESKTSANATLTYKDSKGRTQKAGNLLDFTPLNPAPSPNRYTSGPTTLEPAATMDTGAAHGSYYMAGMAYWANTQPFHPTHHKARVKTYVVDVNEEQASSSSTSFRRTRSMYLAAKYGGFDDAAAGYTGNPYAVGNNSLWQGSDGDARNYFLARDAQKFLDSLADIFRRIAEETGTISGGAVSAQRVTASQDGAVFRSSFNPTADFWSGRVFKSTVTAGTDTVSIDPTPTWEAGGLLTAAAKIDKGASRRIVIGPPAGRQGLDPATPFTWTSLVAAHKTALSTVNNVVDSLGEARLNYLRGDQSQELSGTNPAGTFRPRDIVLGDIVHSGLVYMDRPSAKVVGSADSANGQAASYRTFVQNMAGRKRVVLVNANDGMLHAFDADTGAEVFAYVPGFLSGKLSRLPQLGYTHTSFADATPAVGEAYLNGSWRTALVSGVGGGAQGVFALDVSNPSTFSAANALWEFTERDHPAMGNVLGTPQILKFRVQDRSASGTHTYKTFAVVASGVNNYASDGFAHASGAPSIFLLDLAYKPTATNPWVEGVNFWRIELPQTEASMASGLIGFNSVTEADSNVVSALYAADLQGNLWKLDFSKLGVTGLVSNAATNFQKFNPVKNDAPLFVAKTSGGARQPLTGTPQIVHAYFGKKMVVLGTGKYLEVGDNSVPLPVNASLYAVLDDPSVVDAAAPFDPLPVPGRAALQLGSVSASGAVTVPAFTLGAPASSSPNVKSGWYIDFNATIGERQVSDIAAVGDRLYLSSLFPTLGSCGEGGGRTYSVDALKGTGHSEESVVGVLAAPLVVKLSTPETTPSGTSGRRAAKDKVRVISQGAKGLQTSTIRDTYNYQTGRMSWRLINNYQTHAAP